MKVAEPMRHRHLILVALALAGCATAPVAPPMDLPPELAPPASQVPALEALANGVQIYQCDASPNPGSTGKWQFKAPEATLVDRGGKVLGKHYAGPTWEAVDGSRVVGQLRSSVPGPDASAIPWLALTVKSSSGAGLFASTSSVLRVRTVGGVAPGAPCEAANAGQVAKVPYQATYYFYRAAS